MSGCLVARGVRNDLHFIMKTAVLSDPTSFKSKVSRPFEDASRRKYPFSLPEMGNRNTEVSVIVERRGILLSTMAARCVRRQFVGKIISEFTGQCRCCN